MKKFLLALLIVITVSVSAFGVTSIDITQNVYLRQDVFEAKMDAFMAEIRLLNELLRSELKQEIQATNSRIDVVSTRLDDLYTMVYWGLALMGIILAFSPAAPYLIKALKSIFQHPFTLKDVEKLIDSKLQSKNAQ